LAHLRFEGAILGCRPGLAAGAGSRQRALRHEAPLGEDWLPAMLRLRATSDKLIPGR